MNIHIDKGVADFIHTLEKSTIVKVLRTIDLLERFGHQLGLPHSRSLGNGIFELRIRGAQEIRLLYAYRRNGAIILIGFVKKSSTIPRRFLIAAISRIKALDRI